MEFCWIGFLGAFLGSQVWHAPAQTTLISIDKNPVNERDLVTVTCEYPVFVGGVSNRLAVNGNPGPPGPDPFSLIGRINSSVRVPYMISAISDVKFTLQRYFPTVVEFSFNANRDYDGYNLTCIVVGVFGPDYESARETLSVRYGPCCNKTAIETITCPVGNSFLLDASDIVGDPGNPQINNVMWKFSNRWMAVQSGNRQQYLTVTISSLEGVTNLFDDQPVTATAMNDQGATYLDVTVRVSAITDRPSDLMCSVSVPTAGDAVVALTWSPVSGIGGVVVVGYHILLKNKRTGCINANRTTSNTSFSFSTNTNFIMNNAYTAEIRAISATCPGPAETCQFTAAGPPSSPRDLKCAPSSQSQVLLTWKSPTYQHPSLKFLGYVVAYGNTSSSSPSNWLNESIGGLDTNTTYYFSVTAVNEFGVSKPARTMCSTLEPGIPSPVILNLPEPIPGGVRLSWTASEPGREDLSIEFYNVTYQCECSRRMSKRVEEGTILTLSGLGERASCTFTVTATNTNGATSPVISVSTQVTTTGGFELTCDERSGSVQAEVVAGIAVGCLIVGCVVGALGAVFTVHRSQSWKRRENTNECRPSDAEVELTDSEAYELSRRIPSQATYDDVLTADQRETPSRLTTNPAYSTTVDS